MWLVPALFFECRPRHRLLPHRRQSHGFSELKEVAVLALLDSRFPLSFAPRTTALRPAPATALAVYVAVGFRGTMAISGPDLRGPRVIYVARSSKLSETHVNNTEKQISAGLRVIYVAA